MSFIRQLLFREYSRRINKITQQSPSSIQNNYKESKYPVKSSVPKITISVYLDPKNEKSRFIKNGLRMVFFVSRCSWWDAENLQPVGKTQ